MTKPDCIEPAERADRPACPDVRRVVRPLFQRRGRAVRKGSQRLVGYVHRVVVPAVRERWQWSTDMSGISVSATPASGGVEATLPSGTDLIVSTQTLAYGLFDRGESRRSGCSTRRATRPTRSPSVSTLSSHWARHGDSARDSASTSASCSSLTVRNSCCTRPGSGLRCTGSAFGSNSRVTRGLGEGRSATRPSDATRYYFSLGYRYDL